MNKIMVLFSLAVSMVLIYFGISQRAQMNEQRIQLAQLQVKNMERKQSVKDKEILSRSNPVFLSEEYGVLMDKVRILAGNSGIGMNVALQEGRDAADIADHYVDTPYSGVKALKIKIVVDRFSKETDMGMVLDDIHVLEKSTDFLVSEISRELDHLSVKGEIYGL